MYILQNSQKIIKGVVVGVRGELFGCVYPHVSTAATCVSRSRTTDGGAGGRPHPMPRAARHAPPRALRPAREEPRARRRPGRPIRAPSYGNETRSVARSMRGRGTRVGLTPDLASTRRTRPSPPRASTCLTLEHRSRAQHTAKGAHTTRGACYMVLDVITRTQRNGRKPTALHAGLDRTAGVIVP
jgi:hypothetical protein